MSRRARYHLNVSDIRYSTSLFSNSRMWSSNGGAYVPTLRADGANLSFIKRASESVGIISKCSALKKSSTLFGFRGSSPEGNRPG